MTDSKGLKKEVILRGAPDLNDAGNVIKGVVAEIVNRIHEKSTTSGATPGQPRLFFPNGIDLIEASVSLGLTSKGLEVKIKVAGEKSAALTSGAEEVEVLPAD